MASLASELSSTASNSKSEQNFPSVTRLWRRVGCGVWGDYFLLLLDSTQTFSLDSHNKMENKYISTGFYKWPNTLSLGSVRIFLNGHLYAVTQHLLTRRNFLFLNSLKGFQRSLAEISQYYHFVDNSNHLKDLVICILWTLVMSLFDAQAMILTVIPSGKQTYLLYCLRKYIPVNSVWWETEQENDRYHFTPNGGQDIVHGTGW